MSQTTEGDPRYKVPFQHQEGDKTLFGYEALVPKGRVDRKELAPKIGWGLRYEELAKPGEKVVSPQTGEEIMVPEGYEAYRLTAEGYRGTGIEVFDRHVEREEYSRKSFDEQLATVRQMAQEQGYSAAIGYAMDAYLSSTHTYADVPCGEKEWNVLGDITAKAFGVQPDVMRTFMSGMKALAAHDQIRKNWESG